MLGNQTNPSFSGRAVFVVARAGGANSIIAGAACRLKTLVISAKTKRGATFRGAYIAMLCKLQLSKFKPQAS
jgi:hypothetical protein